MDSTYCLKTHPSFFSFLGFEFYSHGRMTTAKKPRATVARRQNATSNEQRATQVSTQMPDHTRAIRAHPSSKSTCHCWQFMYIVHIYISTTAQCFSARVRCQTRVALSDVCATPPRLARAEARPPTRSPFPATCRVGSVEVESLQSARTYVHDRSWPCMYAHMSFQ